jgi:ferredoxin
MAPGDCRIDLLQWPLVGPFLRWRHARTALQLVLLLVAALVVLDGLLVSRVDPTTFTTVAVWTHYRGLLAVALLAVGNLFCTGCPLVLARDAGRRIRMPTLTLPRWLRTKWTGIALFVAVLFCYELFDLWSLPHATAYLVLAYFGAALTVDLTFKGASFCKYFCPIGQFNFVASTMSPFEMRIKDMEACRTCKTVDCIKGHGGHGGHGGHEGRGDSAPQRGCELRLFLPAKVGNMDCTMCLDCVHACPRDNIALASRVPGAELADPRRRSGIGRFARRPDVAALVVLFTFGSLMNAFGMVAPVHAVESALQQAMGVTSEAPVLALLFVVGLVVAPVLLLGAAAIATRLAAADRGRPFADVVVSFAYALVPFGFGVWLAHYGFHLLTGAFAIVPVTQRAAVDLLGRPALGEPLWRLTGMRPGAVFPIQAGLVALGTLGSLASAFQIAERDYPRRAAAVVLPWAAVIVVLAAAAFWMLSQPMEMRGLAALG